jgi:hypothetical protein
MIMAIAYKKAATVCLDRCLLIFARTQTKLEPMIPDNQITNAAATGKAALWQG